MQITGVLRNARRVPKGSQDPRAPCLNGDIFNDVRGRFADGSNVTTSTVLEEQPDDVFVTRNSVYRVESWAE